MSIKDLFLKIKVWGVNSVFLLKNRAKKAFHADFFTVIVVVLVAFSGFGLGRLSSLEGNKTPILIEKDQSFLFPSDDVSVKKDLTPGKTIQNSSNSIQKYLVASKSGGKYYFPWCGGVSRIKEENKIGFASETEARKSGYTPAANCNGLK